MFNCDDYNQFENEHNCPSRHIQRIFFVGATGPTGPTGPSGGVTGPTGPTYTLKSENKSIY